MYQQKFLATHYCRVVLMFLYSPARRLLWYLLFLKKWQSSKDEAGRIYYYNTNGETVWELPTCDDANELCPKPYEVSYTKVFSVNTR